MQASGLSRLVTQIAIGVAVLVSITTPCIAQVADATNSATPRAPSGAVGSTANSPEEMKEDANPASAQSTPQSTPQPGPQSGAAGFASRVKSFSRNGPKRESWDTINLGTKYVNAVFGGLGGFGFGVQVTT